MEEIMADPKARDYAAKKYDNMQRAQQMATNAQKKKKRKGSNL
jgi:hypothetical protein